MSWLAPPHALPTPTRGTQAPRAHTGLPSLAQLPGSGPHALEVSAVEKPLGLGNKAPGTVLDVEALLSRYLLAS